MKIAICDDCASDRKKLADLIRECIGPSADVCMDEFPNGQALLEQRREYDVVFLDIRMDKEQEGIDTAVYLQQNDENALLVFYTAYDYPASCIANVRPCQYLMKDRGTEDLKAGIQKVMKEAKRRKRIPHILAFDKEKQYVLKTEDILYIAIRDKGTDIYLTKEKASEICGPEQAPKERKEFTLRSTMKLNEHYAKLEEYGFAYGKKSYIINIHYVASITKDTVRLEDGTILNIARSRKKEFDSRCGRYWRG
ncbi:MAG: response regulator transcription factor [Lachnospiraceae bacterium]|nr:response regulator transcription factor [Lachnospiraceae bacterium]